MSLEQVVNESCPKFLFDRVIDFKISRDVLQDVNFWLEFSSWAISARFLVSVSIIETEHELIRDLIQVRYI